MSETTPNQGSTPAGADVQRLSDSRSGPFRFIAVLLIGILLVLAGILYVMIENQGAMIENQGAMIENQNVIVENQGAMIENQNVIVENQGAMIENQNESLEHQRAKEVACEIDGGEISWNTRGNQICDLSPFAKDEGGKFDFDIDWIIR